MVSLPHSLINIGNRLKQLVWILSFFYTSSLFAANNTVVTIETVSGTFQLELLADEAPNSVQNFLNYVERGAYDGTFFHRSVPGFVIQGGGFSYNAASNTAQAIVVDPPVVNEFGESNIRGTVAMAKTSAGPDTATSQWFVNLADNSANLDNQNGGFTVFARVIGDGMQVADRIAALPRVNLDNGGTFSSTPTIGFTDSVNASIFVTITQASAVSDPDFDNDGIPDSTDTDDDNDGVPDVSDAFSMNAAEFADTDNDGTGNNADTDDDGDGVLDINDAFPLDSSETTDSDGDGVGDNSDDTVRLDPAKVLFLPIVGETFTNSNGVQLTIPSNATAVSLNVAVVNPSSAGFVTVWPCGRDRPNASNVNYVAGDIIPNGVIAPIGTDGSVCFFSLADTDLVVDIAGWFIGDIFSAATPTRLVDTRFGTGSPIGLVESARPLTVQVGGVSVLTAFGDSTMVPSDVTAAAINVAVVNPQFAGFLTVYPCDSDLPIASNLNYSADEVVANGVIAPVSAQGTICVHTLAPTDIVVDLAGWFTGSGFVGATPNRLVDTRNGTGAPASRLVSGAELSVPVIGKSLIVGGSTQQIPASATAVALNVVAVSPESAGFITVYPCGVGRPNASNVNYVSGDISGNNVIAPIGGDGSVCFFTLSTTDLVVDVSGWFVGDDTNQFVGVTPNRLVDTRDGTGPTPR
jgi:cyclophilin family peptidyl-prolyl cis-trans isomerase